MNRPPLPGQAVRRFVLCVLLANGWAACGRTLCPSEPRVVTDPDSGQTVLDRELTILGGARDIASLVRPFGGVITVTVPETNTHQVCFPVESLEDLERIATRLEEEGVRVSLVHVMRPPRPGRPQ